MAAEAGEAEIASILVKAGAAIDAVNRFNETPLYFAAYDGHTDVVRVLIEAGADRTIKNKEGKDAVFAAQASMEDAVIELVCGVPDAEGQEKPEEEEIDEGLD